MRLNKYLALGSELSRRGADKAITTGRVRVNGNPAAQGMDVGEHDVVTLDDQVVTPQMSTLIVMFHKPRGYVVSRYGQGSQTIYDILPADYHHLNPVGRLDKDSSGLLLLTNDGHLAHELTHPSRQKIKMYQVTLDKPLQPFHRQMINDHGIMLEDGLSRLQIEREAEGNDTAWIVTMHEGRNRQIRRTFESLGYTVTTLHRTQFGPYRLFHHLPSGKTKLLTTFEQK